MFGHPDCLHKPEGVSASPNGIAINKGGWTPGIGAGPGGDGLTERRRSVTA